jgi:hypothetical protein
VTTVDPSEDRTDVPTDLDTVDTAPEASPTGVSDGSAIEGRPFWTVVFDADGDAEAETRQAFIDGVGEQQLTDVFVFAHGWNNDRSVATTLFTRFFTLLVGQLREHAPGRVDTVGLAGVVWPSRRWSDEPIPDFPPATSSSAHTGEASATARMATEVEATAEIDQDTLDGLCELFPAAADELRDIAALLTSEPTQETLDSVLTLMRTFVAKAGVADTDVEQEPVDGELGSAAPGMLDAEADQAFEGFWEGLRAMGMTLDEGGDGEASLGTRLRGALRGAKEALRQLTYWQMKNRAGVVGRQGLGRLLADLQVAAPDVRVHLIGHSFGARLVSFSLAGLPEGLDPSPVKAVTLLQGAFSQFAFASPLPFDAGRHGALKGMLDRIDGPLTVCFSKHDSAVGVLYPLASIAARDDAAALGGADSRWGAMGANGAQGVGARVVGIEPVDSNRSYPFAPRTALNVDAAEVVRDGRPPSGAHSDIIHPELSWVVLQAGGVVEPSGG